MCWNRRRYLLYLRRRFYTLRCGDRLRLACIAITLVLATGLFYLFHTWICPVLEAAASKQATDLITERICTAVDDCLTNNHLSYSDFVSLQTDWTGNVNSLTKNTAANSRFKRQVIDIVIEQIEGLDCDELSIPLGNLTGQTLLSGHGPSIQVEVYSVESVTADYSSTFTAAGTNRTLHTLHLNVTAQVQLISLGEVFHITINSTVPVAETVMIGNMSGAY